MKESTLEEDIERLMQEQDASPQEGYEEGLSSDSEYPQSTTVTDGYTRTESPGFLGRKVFGRADYDWQDLWKRYECFQNEVEYIVRSYGIDPESAEPRVKVNTGGQGSDSQWIESREEAIELDTLENIEVDPESHSWEWMPHEGIEFEVRYYDGEGTDKTEQVGITMTVENQEARMVDDLVETMEDWFGEKKKYRRKNSARATI